MDEKAATFREVFAVREYLYLYVAYTLSVLGDQLAKVALAFLVFDRTHSPALSAATYAVSYAPAIFGAAFLSGLADRFPRRTVAIVCDVARMALVALLALPGLSVGILIAIIFVANVFSVPFASARSAIMPEVLEGDRYVVGNSVDNITNQLCQVLGFALGGPAVLLLTARGALVVDSLTFAASAVLLWVGVLDRPAAAIAARAGGGIRAALRDSREGAKLVFGDSTLRAYLLLLWVGSTFAYAVEGLVAPLAHEFDGGPTLGGVLLALGPLGMATGGLVVGRMCSPALRIRLTLPLATVACAVLIPVLWHPPLAAVLVLLFVMGFGTSYILPLNPLYVRAVPTDYRGRAMGVAISGLNLTQGLGMVLAGVVAERLTPTTVVGLSGLIGTAGVLGLAFIWPHPTFRADPRRAGADPSGEAAA